MSKWLDRIFEQFHVENSIRRRLKISFIIILVIMLLPAMVSLLILESYGQQYHAVISRVGHASRLRPLISTTLPDELFMVVAGKETAQESSASDDVARFENELASLLRANPDQTELLVVNRTLDTLRDYMGRLMDMAQKEAPVAEQEKMLDEIRSVASLMGEMLDQYVMLEIETADTASARLQSDLRFLVLGEAIFLLLAALFAAIAQNSLSSAIRRPITELETLAQTLAGGNLQARAKQVRTLELVGLGSSLNTMADKLERLMEENRREQENLKRSELRTLQAQITPHFLYNTLDAIVWLAQTGRVPEVIQVTKAMSRFFRISLSQGRDWISIEQEVSHIEGYLTIQKVRYRDILDYEINVDPALYPFQILKLTIQPLVENAIYHGVKHRREGGKVTVEGKREGDTLLVRVTDNGAGMTPERLQTVRDMLDEKIPLEDDGSGFGLYNVNKRIKLYYGLSDGLRLESDGTGTCVSFSVPLRSSEKQ